MIIFHFQKLKYQLKRKKHLFNRLKKVKDYHQKTNLKKFIFQLDIERKPNVPSSTNLTKRPINQKPSIVPPKKGNISKPKQAKTSLPSQSSNKKNSSIFMLYFK